MVNQKRKTKQTKIWHKAVLYGNSSEVTSPRGIPNIHVPPEDHQALSTVASSEPSASPTGLRLPNRHLYGDES